MNRPVKAGIVLVGGLFLVGVGASLGDNAPAPTPSPPPTPEVVYVTPPPTPRPTPTPTPTPTPSPLPLTFDWVQFGEHLDFVIESTTRIGGQMGVVLDCADGAAPGCDIDLELLLLWGALDEDIRWLQEHPPQDCYASSHDAYLRALRHTKRSVEAAAGGDWGTAADLMDVAVGLMSNAYDAQLLEMCP